MRVAFTGGPVDISGGGRLEGPATSVLVGEGICGGRDRGECGAAGWERIGAGEEGAENRDDGESRLLVSPRVGVAGYATFNDVDNIMVGRMADRNDGRGRDDGLGICKSLGKFLRRFV